MAVISPKALNAKYGVFPPADIPEVTSWTFSWNALVQKYASSDTSARKDAVAGTKSWTATVSVKTDVATHVSTYVPGDDSSVQQLQLFENTSFASAYYGTAVVTNISPEINIETGEIVASVISFKGSGPIVYGTPE